jgi:hypothetical protein
VRPDLAAKYAGEESIASNTQAKVAVIR